MARSQEVRVLVTGGGTAGHINPGLAVISQLRSMRPGSEFLWVGTEDRLEARLVPNAGVEIAFIRVAFIKGRGLVGKIKAALRLPGALWQSYRLLRRFKPDVVVGVGGFASGPVALMAGVMRTPTAILEQNARPGLTNRILGKVARRVFVSFEEAGGWFSDKKVKLFGNPVRPTLLKAFGKGRDRGDGETAHVLVIGGSQGATSLNRDLPGVLAAVAQRGVAIAVRHSAGRGRSEDVRTAYGEMAEVTVHEYIDDMADAYAWADFVVCRAGASTVAELSAVGKPAMYVPFPAAADNHQEKNALAVVTKGGGVLVKDAELKDEPPIELLEALLTDVARLGKMGSAARSLARPNAAREIAQEILSLVK